MITDKIEDHHKRKGASCLECDWLNNETDPCFLRANILHPTEIYSNYASEGCVKYKGNWVGKASSRPLIQRIRKEILEGGKVSREECVKQGLTMRQICALIRTVQKRGFRVKYSRSNNETFYSI